jgi:uncharacterized protein (TIGR03435 family)
MRLAIAFSILAAVLASAQPPGAPAFEVASVKHTDPSVRMGITLFTYPGGRVRFINSPLLYIVQQAFDEQKIIFPNAPAWVNDDAFDIDARPPADSKSSKSNPTNIKLPPNEEQREMLQTLLAERFGLTFHSETKEDSVYLLTRGKTLKLQESTDPNVYPWAGSAGGGAFSGDGIAGTNITMSQLAKRLTPILGRPVIDGTALTGAFDFKYSYASGSDRPDEIASLIASLDAIGLKLESSKAPVPSIVIDRVEKPEEN